MARYSFESDPGEHAPLDNPHVNEHYSAAQSPNRRSSPSRNHRQTAPQYYQDDPPSLYRGASHTSPARATNRPNSHPDSEFARLRDERRRSRGYGIATGTGGGGAAAAAIESTRAPPNPPPHWGNSGNPAWTNSAAQSNITPGVDNFNENAAGGLAGIASTLAERNPRESGMDAMRGAVRPPGGRGGAPYASHGQYRDSSPSLTPMGAAAIPSGAGTPARSHHSSFASDPFEDGRYGYAQRRDPNLGMLDPNDIMDDGDDGLEYGTRRSARNSMLSLGGSSSRGGNGGSATAAAAVAGGAAAGGVLGGIVGSRNRNNYGPVSNPGAANQGAAAANIGSSGAGKEQSAWMKSNTGSKKKWRWVAIITLVVLVLGGIVAGVLLGVVFKKGSSSSKSGGGGGESASDDTSQNGDLNINSSEIQALLNNKNLHKVFPGVDYTPINTQFPDCLTNPPSQNNVTRDMAVLSQLTNVIRLYGTDCNQTEMTIHAINQLGMQDDIKIWLGVWQDNNATTNARQLSQMYDILNTYGASPFKGLIVANEILFREQMTVTELGTLLNTVRTNISSMGIDLPVATSDLGDNWTSELAEYSDLIMSNIHPFFAGVPASEAAGWAWSFWSDHDSAFVKSTASDNVIAEIGWPSQGGTDCGSDTVTTCSDGSVAGIDEMNTLMSNWVCQALDNGTNYFWFEMFDEPWKIIYDTTSEAWEDHWGLMDVDRNLKDGVVIPDCGGKTVS
ncbi:glycoside hydrolase superfamily [Xylariales sp. PMI_506]|nr:glycoside hydrolase superfamily [Xylariales sp. PMI_506]